MFAYCRNGPVFRIDISGAYDLDCDDTDPIDDDLVHEEGRSGCTDSSICTGNSSTNGGETNNTLRIGGGHGNPVHSERINSFMDDLVASGDYQVVYGNRALSTAGLEGSQRPDVIAIHNDGSYEIWEFASPSQAFGTRGYSMLDTKIQTMHATNPNAKFNRIVPW